MVALAGFAVFFRTCHFDVEFSCVGGFSFWPGAGFFPLRGLFAVGGLACVPSSCLYSFCCLSGLFVTGLVLCWFAVLASVLVCVVDVTLLVGMPVHYFAPLCLARSRVVFVADFDFAFCIVCRLRFSRLPPLLSLGFGCGEVFLKLTNKQQQRNPMTNHLEFGIIKCICDKTPEGWIHTNS